MEFAVIAGLILIITINLAASLYIGRAPGYERSQKSLQIVLIWILPVVGAAFFSYFLWHDRKVQRLTRQIGNHTSISNSDAVRQYGAANHRGGR